MAQHYDISKYQQKYFRQIETSFEKKFKNGFQKVKYSLKFHFIDDERAKEHPNDEVFRTAKRINKFMETFEIHFDSKLNIITKIYLVV